MKVQERIADYAVLTQSTELRPLGELIKPTRPRVKPSEKPHLPFIGVEHLEAHTMRLLGTVPASTMEKLGSSFSTGRCAVWPAASLFEQGLSAGLQGSLLC